MEKTQYSKKSRLVHTYNLDVEPLEAIRFLKTAINETRLGLKHLPGTILENVITEERLDQFETFCTGVENDSSNYRYSDFVYWFAQVPRALTSKWLSGLISEGSIECGCVAPIGRTVNNMIRFESVVSVPVAGVENTYLDIPLDTKPLREFFNIK